MLQFMGDNNRLIHFHEQKLYDLEAFKSDTQVFQKNTSASLKNLETQVGQLALNIPNQSNGTFPSDTQKNPKDYMAIQLRSGKEVSNNQGTKFREMSVKYRRFFGYRWRSTRYPPPIVDLMNFR